MALDPVVEVPGGATLPAAFASADDAALPAPAAEARSAAAISAAVADPWEGGIRSSPGLIGAGRPGFGSTTTVELVPGWADVWFGLGVAAGVAPGAVPVLVGTVPGALAGAAPGALTGAAPGALAGALAGAALSVVTLPVFCTTRREFIAFCS